MFCFSYPIGVQWYGSSQISHVGKLYAVYWKDHFHLLSPGSWVDSLGCSRCNSYAYLHTGPYFHWGVLHDFVYEHAYTLYLKSLCNTTRYKLLSLPVDHLSDYHTVRKVPLIIWLNCYLLYMHNHLITHFLLWQTSFLRMLSCFGEDTLTFTVGNNGQNCGGHLSLTSKRKNGK